MALDDPSEKYCRNKSCIKAKDKCEWCSVVRSHALVTMLAVGTFLAS